ncbi:ABC transporter permease [Halorarum halophilum]|uniref:ABC transporter permease n=1 Tax=Halorarum halophilum TaxID=2743090 RepID=A0A7D5GBI6_9EURY|nr:ABC transporter permease [Halobaculum halophilum]QLG27492.1 ABC transporter permease [Halobaculum halophilum]
MSEGGPPSDDDAGDGRFSAFRERATPLLARLTRASATERLLISGSALLLSVVIGFFLILGAGRMTSCQSAAYSLLGVGFCYDPFVVYDRLFLGAFGNLAENPLNGQFATTLGETTVLLFTGLAVAVAFKAGIFNIGGQGQLVVGALATALAVLAASSFVSGLVGTLVLVPFGLVVGAVAGGLFGAIPGALKAYADANEVITTIMLNFVATSVALYLVQNHFKDPDSFATQTRALPEYAVFPRVVFPDRANVSLLALGFALVLAAAMAYLLVRTAFGYDLRTSGLQPEAAEYGGVDAARTVVASMALSGALAGIGGAVYVMMILGNFQTGVPDYGFDGITVSILAGNNPLGVAAAALLFGVLKSGSIVVDVGTDVPPQLVGVLRGLIVLFVAMPEFFRMAGRYAGLDTAERDTVAADGGRVVDDDGGSEGGEDR